MTSPSLLTRTAKIELLSASITAVRIDPKATQNVDDARENIATAVRLGLPGKRPLLVDIRGCQPLEAEVRHFYSGQILVDSFTALCMLLDLNPLGQMMGNLYMRVAKPGIPTRLCSNEADALQWLSSFLPPGSRK